MKHTPKLTRILGTIALVAAAVIAGEVGAAFYPPLPPFTNPSRDPVPVGAIHSPPLAYVVMGDSTAAGQGTDYAQGIAMGTAAHLAQTHHVTMTNLAVSGATVGDVLHHQLADAVRLKPDLILLSIGANDVTHLTGTAALQSNLTQLLDRLLASHCETKIVLTGSPDMGSAPRFAQPLRWFAGVRVGHINEIFMPIIAARHLTFAPIAAVTGPIFRQDHSLFASDRFHPNDRGYAVWIPVLNRALDDALKNQPSHCGAN